MQHVTGAGRWNEMQMRGKIHFTCICKWRPRCKTWNEVEICIYSCKCKCIWRDGMKNGGEKMSFIVTFGEKEKSKYTESENNIFFDFPKCDFWSKSDLLDAITRKTLCVIMSCKLKKKWDGWKWKRKMGLHACADGKWDEKHVIAFCWVKDEVSWHGNGMWKMTMLSH